MTPRPRTAPGGGPSRRRSVRPGGASSPSATGPAWEGGAGESRSGPPGSAIDIVLTDFTARWERGETPRVEDYLDRLGPDPSAGLIDLIYREYCMAEWAGLDPRPDDYLARFPLQGSSLERLLGVHDALGSTRLRLWAGPRDAAPSLPEVGDEVGTYRLVRELGRGGFARVFLAEQSDLEDRLVVVKVTSRVTPEPQLQVRASHPYIAEVIWHGLVDDGSLQVICMPFLGGATLAALLAGRRGPGPRPVSGRDLLEDLDRASAPGYPAPGSGRPAREVIAGLSYPRAAAWVVARLAEALDHAYGRGVLHGDVKPSNVLLTADGTPMLLDFNLAVGWRVHEARPGAAEAPGDVGGTLAYMAPERLKAAADPAGAERPSANDRHRADIYATGLVLLEMLTGRPPGQPGVRPRSLYGLASAFTSSRRGGGGVLDRPAGTPLPAGLRAILSRCLANEPADRYRRASELAEDLDRWRTDRPPAFAREPGRTLGLVRWARRRRLAVAVAMTGLSVAAACGAFAHRADRDFRRQRAVKVYDQIRRDDSGAFATRQPGDGLVKLKGDPVETARRYLDFYGVLDPSCEWRRRDDFRNLPAFERGELGAWLLEQSLRFARALRERSGDPGDLQRALLCLDRASGGTTFTPLRAERRRLLAKLDAPGPPDDPHAPAAPERWVEDYLLGVEAELDGDPDSAADHYGVVLSTHPGSFWAHYRAASVAFAHGTAARAAAYSAAFAPEQSAATLFTGAAAADREKYECGEAARHMAVCVEQCPDNPALHVLLAGCLYGQGRLGDADAEFHKAVNAEPDRAGTFLLRSVMRIRLGQLEGYRQDIGRYNVLTGRPGQGGTAGLKLAAFTGAAADLDGPRPAPRGAIETDSDESLVRKTLGTVLANAKQYEFALEEFDRSLEISPDDLRSLWGRAILRVNLRRDDADQGFASVVGHPHVEALVQALPEALCAFDHTVNLLIRRGETRLAVETAERGAALAAKYRSHQFESKFVHARALAAAAKDDPGRRGECLERLREAYRLDARQLREWYQGEPEFGDLRAELGVDPFSSLPAYLDR